MLAKIVVNTSEELLDVTIEDVIEKIASTLGGQFKASATLIEALVSIMVHLEDAFSPYVARFIPILIELV